MGSASRALLASTFIIGFALQATCVEGATPTNRKEYKNRYYEATIEKTTEKGKCVQEIVITGNGVDANFNEPCVEDLAVVNTDELLAIGNPKSDPLSVLCFSDTPNVVVTIKENQCTMMIYSEGDPQDDKGLPTNGDVPTDVTTMRLRDEVCTDLQGKVNKIIKTSKDNNGGSDKDGEDDSEDESVSDTKLRSKYEVTVTKSTNKGKCIQEIKIKGNGVEDVFKGPCVEDLQKVNRNTVLAVGDPEINPFTLFSDSANTLVILKDDVCKKKTYKTANGVTTSKSSELDDDECEEIKEKIKKAFGKSKSVKGDTSDDKLMSKFVVTSKNSERRGKCTKEIKIEGNGVEDSFRGPCVDDLPIINEVGVLVVGDPDKASLTIYTDKPNSLITLINGLCKEKTYKTVKGMISSSSTDLEDEECEKIEEKIKKELKMKWYSTKDDSSDKKLTKKFVVTNENTERRGRCTKEIKIQGNGVEDSFRGPCVDDLPIINEVGVLVVGDPDKASLTIFTDKPNSLITLSFGTCKEKTYKTVNGKVTSSTTELDEEDCDKVIEKIKNELNKKQNPIKDEEEVDKYTVTTESTERRGKCIQDIKIQGGGIEDTFRRQCVDDLVILKKDVLLVKDPREDTFALFSDKENSLVILKDGFCKERTYKTVKGKTTSSSTDLDDDECDEVEDKIQKTLKEKEKADKAGGKKEVKIYSVDTESFERRGKCVQEIKIEGNGVKDSFRGPCDNLKILNLKDRVVIGYPGNEPFTLYSAKANSLVVLKDGMCKEKIYKTVDGKTTNPSSKIMDDEECEELEDTIEDIISKN